jgi:glutathione S-transferase
MLSGLPKNPNQEHALITLHGFSYSNYYNIVKHTLLHKGLPFQEDLQFGDSPDYLAVSPMGKIPAITTESGEHLSETSVCCDYLEDAYPDREPLYPAAAIDRARVRQIMRISELYLELPCRKLIPFAFSNTDAPEALAQEIREVLARGINAMNLLCRFEPYLLGGDITMADIYLRYVLKVVALGSNKLSWDIVAEVKGLAEWQRMMADTDIARRIDADEAANGPAFFAHIKERFGI